MIKSMKSTMEKKVTAEDKKKYEEALRSILNTAPECKKKEVQDMLKLVEKLQVTKKSTQEEDDL